MSLEQLQLLRAQLQQRLQQQQMVANRGPH
jgi:hypothetical protein